MESTLKHPKLERLRVQTQTETEREEEEEEGDITNNKKKKQKQVWDCGSTLYDSFELNSFKRQLDSAIGSSSRTLSMPHLTADGNGRVPPAAASVDDAVAKKSSSSNKISRSLHKLLKSVFRSNNSDSNKAQQQSGSSSSRYSTRWLKLRDRTTTSKAEIETYCFYYDKTGALTTIPEGPEIGGALSPDNLSSLLRRTASDRSFTPPTPTFTISCA